MNTDRELLVLAAKASGLTTRHKWNSERLALNPPVADMVVHLNGELVTTGWNPLTNDGDALRLAAKLHLQITISPCHCDVYSPEHDLGISENFKDNCEATRRAIVRAAAEIGRAMP